MIPSSPGDELNDLFARTLFILPGVIGDRSERVISSWSGDGITFIIPYWKTWVLKGVVSGVRAISYVCKVIVSFSCREK